jgi:2,4-dienoyl-CoA reductase-like NADH-dependent reductase (Old Yellow Enzyme family)
MPIAVTPPAAHAALKDTVMFSPLKLGKLNLKHRIVQVRSKSQLLSPKEQPNDILPGTQHSHAK